MTARTQTLLSVLVSFTFYFIWTWYANSRVTDDFNVLLRTALVQSSYSAFVTLIFTSMLSWTTKKMKCQKQPFLAIIPPLILQSVMVYLINYINQTPNLLLTIIPSIFFTGVYGVIFTFSLLKKPEFQCDSENDADNTNEVANN